MTHEAPLQTHHFHKILQIIQEKLRQLFKTDTNGSSTVIVSN